MVFIKSEPPLFEHMPRPYNTENFFFQFVPNWSNFWYVTSSCDFMLETGFGLQKASKLTELWPFKRKNIANLPRHSKKNGKNGNFNFAPMRAIELIFCESKPLCDQMFKMKPDFPIPLVGNV